MFAYAIQSTLGGLNLDTEEGRVEGLQRAVPLIARIRDPSLRDAYATKLADDWVGWPNIRR